MLIEHCQDPILQRDLKRMEDHSLDAVDKMIHHYDRATADERGKRTEEVCNRNFAQGNKQGKGGKQGKQCSKCGKKGHTNKE